MRGKKQTVFPDGLHQMLNCFVCGKMSVVYTGRVRMAQAIYFWQKN